MLKIVADDKIPFLQGALEHVAQVVYLPGNKISRDHLNDADALIVRTRTKCDETLLKGTPVKMIASATIGFDHIDTNYCEASGIRWVNAPGCNSGSVNQYISSALAEIICAGKKSFGDIVLGIIGVGNVGSKVASLAKTLGMKTLLNDPPRERNEGTCAFADLETLVSQSDIISLHVPLSNAGIDKTFHFADDNFFSGMKPAAWFINTSRGEVVQTRALINALESSHLSGAVIDVWEDEPKINHKLLKLAHIATPHIAGYSADGKANGTAMAVQAISGFFGLGMDAWRPQNIPQALKYRMELNCRAKSKVDIFYELSNFAYNIRIDSENLKSSPETFEKQRENYPIRREPDKLFIRYSGQDKCGELIRSLGYQVSNL